jgi:hypothetical protein
MDVLGLGEFTIYCEKHYCTNSLAKQFTSFILQTILHFEELPPSLRGLLVAGGLLFVGLAGPPDSKAGMRFCSLARWSTCIWKRIWHFCRFDGVLRPWLRGFDEVGVTRY